MKLDNLLGIDNLNEEQEYHYKKTLLAMYAVKDPIEELARIKKWVVEDLVRKKFKLSDFKSEHFQDPSAKHFEIIQSNPDIESHYNHLMNRPLTEIYDLWIKEIKPALFVPKKPFIIKKH